jgi:hypothetical protein
MQMESPKHETQILITTLGHATIQAISHQILTLASQVNVQVNPVGLVVDKVAVEQVYL